MLLNCRRILYEVLFTVDLKRGYVGQNQYEEELFITLNDDVCWQSLNLWG
jgi:hypothetical protein